MTQSHYSLRWNNHQSHILSAFDALLQTESLVDVTLVCAELSVRAHKVVLSACSPLFQRIFGENPCKHPVIVLKDFTGWEIQALVDFMYKGEISVVQDQLQSLIKAAESLQIRGLASQDPVNVEKESASIVNQTPTPSTSPNDYDRQLYSSGNKYPMPGVTVRTPTERSSPFSPIHNNFEAPPLKLPHMSRLSFPDPLMPRSECQSPLPRRKQARPRRRSGELSGPQDLSTGLPKPASPLQPEETAENLCMKKREEKPVKQEPNACTPEPSAHSPDMDMSTPSSGKEFRSSPVSAHQPTPMSLKQEIDSQSPLPFPPMPTVSALAMTPPHSKFFGLDAPLNLFPPGLEGCRNALFELGDHRAMESPLVIKRKMGRPKGQHSAPRGGPPRSWTNAELTEALQQVWNKKMTTSQASRIFGIPYNSLLMYVRGKYGKSLKLEQLRKDCIGGPNQQQVDMIGNNNNNMSKNVDRGDMDQLQPNTRPSSTDQEQMPPQHPMFNPFAHNFYPDFTTGFPIPVNMIHLLPQSEKNRTEHNAYGQTAPHDDEMNKQSPAKEMDEDLPQDMYRSQAMNVDDRRELVQQNGQD